MIVKNKFKVNLQIKRPVIKFIYSVYIFYKLQKIINDKIIIIIFSLQLKTYVRCVTGPWYIRIALTTLGFFGKVRST